MRYSLINFRLINIIDTASKLDTYTWKYFDIKKLPLLATSGNIQANKKK